MYISHTKSFNIPVSIALATLTHMINVFVICLNTTNYPIFNMQDFRYCLWTSNLDCFGQLVSSPCESVSWVASWVFPLSEPHNLKLTCCLAFTFVMADFAVNKSCRLPKCLLIYALNITVNDYFLFYWILTFSSSWSFINWSKC